MSLAAALVGYARLANWLVRWHRGAIALIAVWVLTAGLLTSALVVMLEKINRQPLMIPTQEIAAIWNQIDQVRPEEGVLAAYEVSSQLSSRKLLYSYILFANRPPTYPALPAQIRWIFYKDSNGIAERFQDQGFQIVHKGRSLTILRREKPPS